MGLVCWEERTSEFVGILSTSWAHRENRQYNKISKRGGGKVVLTPGGETGTKALPLSSSGANFTFPGCPLMVYLDIHGHINKTLMLLSVNYSSLCC